MMLALKLAKTRAYSLDCIETDVLIEAERWRQDRIDDYIINLFLVYLKKSVCNKIRVIISNNVSIKMIKLATEHLCYSIQITLLPWLPPTRNPVGIHLLAPSYLASDFGNSRDDRF